MIRSLFNIMVHGISYERLVMQMDEAMKKGTYRRKEKAAGSEDESSKKSSSKKKDGTQKKK